MFSRHPLSLWSPYISSRSYFSSATFHHTLMDIHTLWTRCGHSKTQGVLHHYQMIGQLIVCLRLPHKSPRTISLLTRMYMLDVPRDCPTVYDYPTNPPTLFLYSTGCTCLMYQEIVQLSMTTLQIPLHYPPTHQDVHAWCTKRLSNCLWLP